MEVAKSIFYMAYTANGRTLIDRLIAWIDGCPTSHIELVLREDDLHWYTIGCHRARGGVREAKIPKSDDWLEMSHPAPDDWRERALSQVGKSYADLGLLKTKWAWVPKFSRGFVCSTFIAWVLRLPKYDLYGMKDIWRYILGIKFSLSTPK